MASQKNLYGFRVREEAEKLAQAYYKLRELEIVYFDRGYNAGGADPITDADLDGSVVGDNNLYVTAANIGSGITLAQQLNNFMTNQAVSQAEYEATLSTLRNEL